MKPCSFHRVSCLCSANLEPVIFTSTINTCGNRAHTVIQSTVASSCTPMPVLQIPCNQGPGRVRPQLLPLRNLILRPCLSNPPTCHNPLCLVNQPTTRSPPSLVSPPTSHSPLCQQGDKRSQHCNLGLGRPHLSSRGHWTSSPHSPHNTHSSRAMPSSSTHSMHNSSMALPSSTMHSTHSSRAP